MQMKAVVAVSLGAVLGASCSNGTTQNSPVSNAPTTIERTVHKDSTTTSLPTTTLPDSPEAMVMVPGISAIEITPEGTIVGTCTRANGATEKVFASSVEEAMAQCPSPAVPPTPPAGDAPQLVP